MESYLETRSVIDAVGMWHRLPGCVQQSCDTAQAESSCHIRAPPLSQAMGRMGRPRVYQPGYPPASVPWPPDLLVVKGSSPMQIDNR